MILQLSIFQTILSHYLQYYSIFTLWPKWTKSKSLAKSWKWKGFGTEEHKNSSTQKHRLNWVDFDNCSTMIIFNEQTLLLNVLKRFQVDSWPSDVHKNKRNYTVYVMVSRIKVVSEEEKSKWGTWIKSIERSAYWLFTWFSGQKLLSHRYLYFGIAL